MLNVKTRNSHPLFVRNPAVPILQRVATCFSRHRCLVIFMLFLFKSSASEALMYFSSVVDACSSQKREMDPYHFHMEIAEKTAEQLATNAELKKDSPDILVPFAAKFMEEERLLSLK